MTAAVMRSDLRHWIPVKYSSVDPDSTNSAAIFRCCIRDCTFARRALRSCGGIGWAPLVSELKPSDRESAAAKLTLAAAALAVAIPRKRRLDTVIIIPLHVLPRAT